MAVLNSYNAPGERSAIIHLDSFQKLPVQRLARESCNSSEAINSSKADMVRGVVIPQHCIAQLGLKGSESAAGQASSTSRPVRT